MSINTNVTELDAAQAFKRTYDVSNDAIRTVVATGTQLSISLDAADGDNVAVEGISSSSKASITSSDSGVVIVAASCAGMKSFQLYAKTTSAITGSQACTLEVSPSDTDNVWIATSVTITPSATNNAVVMSSASSSVVARRMRVSIAASITSGTFDLYLVAQGV